MAFGDKSGKPRKNRPRANLLTPSFVGNARKRIRFREKKFASILHRISVEIISQQTGDD